MRAWIWGSLWMFLFVACQDGTGETQGSDVGALDGAAVCSADAAQCPAGSSLSVEVAGCDGQAEGVAVMVKDVSTAVCLGQETCALACVLEEPCLCGIAERSAERVVCTECVAACGNGSCEPEENAESCEQDCGPQCTPKASRCRGNALDVCDAEGYWVTDRECANNEVCRVGDQGPTCEVCDVDNPPLWYVDRDGDGFGDPEGATLSGCLPISRFVKDNTDCDDTQVYLNPTHGCQACEARISCGVGSGRFCDRGACVCEPGYVDCDGDGASCEIFVVGDDTNCGACGVSCEDGFLCGGSQCLETSVPHISSGERHTCAVRQGEVWCWGSNLAGQLGKDGKSPSATPVRVEGIGEALAVAPGWHHSCALLSDGTVRCWGENRFGQLGDGTTNDSRSPVAVNGITEATAIASGSEHTCVLLSAGQVQCWGSNFSGQLGDGSTTDSANPVTSSLTNATAISAGSHRTCTVSSGSVHCWGARSESYEELGEIPSSFVPRLVRGLTDVTQVGVGQEHTCALKNTGEVYCWGDNYFGVSGGIRSLEPVFVQGIDGKALQISVGNTHSCVLLESGRSLCWGNNFDGRLGNGTSTSSDVPVAVTGLEDAIEVSAGGFHTCALLRTGEAQCWGFNVSGQLGEGSLAKTHVPVSTALSSAAAEVAIGNLHSCARNDDGSVWCWGQNSEGQLGDGTLEPSNRPVAVTGLDDAVQLSVGGNHSCVLRASSGVWCWGFNFYGEAGDGTHLIRNEPVPVVGLSTDILSVGTGYAHSCAVLSTGRIRCWGHNAFGQLGNGSTTLLGVTEPVSVALFYDALSVSGGTSHSCAVTDTGNVRCWGRNNHGQLGNGTTNDRSRPTTAIDVPNAVMVSAGGEHTCALVSSGEVYCWGYNGARQLGDGTVLDRLSPIPVPGITDAIAISAGALHTCALLGTSGQVRCWGTNKNGQLGDGGLLGEGDALNTLVHNISGAISVSAGTSHSCTALDTGEVFCWGDRLEGKLGDGYAETRLTPVKVIGLPPL